MSNSVKCFFMNRFRYFRPNRSAPPKLRFVQMIDPFGMPFHMFEIPIYDRKGHDDGYQTRFKVRRSYGKPVKPVFVSIDSVDMDSMICETYIADTNEMWACIQEHDDPWSTCKGCHEIIDDCYC